MSEQSQVDQVQSLIARLQQGDDSARAELINCACDRLMNLTRKIKRSFGNVQRWEETEDVFQRATMRLYQSLEKVTPNDTRHFFRLAALQIRRELIDLTRHYSGPQGIGGNHATQLAGSPSDSPVPHAAYDAADQTGGPAHMQQWSEFHQAIEDLPEELREVTELLFYHELEQTQAAELMGVSVRTIKRYWRDAKLALYEKFDGELPGSL
ncbi:sigma-70 family RNA polymerase sigma factor [Mariniblastus sp.]|nr:sigma-70 family RNA polymerase sigma factor [Mariniblastus sp.]